MTIRAVMVACSVSVAACTSLPDDRELDGVVRSRDTGGVDDAGAADDTTAPSDTFVSDDTTSPVDSAATMDSSDVADSEPADTYAPPTDTGPPPATWTTVFPDKTIDKGDWRSDLACVHADLNEGTSGGRTLPYEKMWRSFTATVNVEADALTCPEMFLRFTVAWDCAFTCTYSKVVQFKIARATGITTYTVTGPLSPTITDPFTPGPKVRLGLAQYGDVMAKSCGRVDIWPGSVTFSE
jgi:hypothetical protein